MSEILSLTHHTFLVGPWPKAPAGSVLVTQADDEDQVVLILKPDDVAKLIDALRAAAGEGTPEGTAFGVPRSAEADAEFDAQMDAIREAERRAVGEGTPEGTDDDARWQRFAEERKRLVEAEFWTKAWRDRALKAEAALKTCGYKVPEPPPDLPDESELADPLTANVTEDGRFAAGEGTDPPRAPAPVSEFDRSLAEYNVVIHADAEPLIKALREWAAGSVTPQEPRNG